MTKESISPALAFAVALAALAIGILIGRSLQPDPPVPVDPRALVQGTITETGKAVGDQTLRCLEAKDGSTAKEVAELKGQLASVMKDLAESNKKMLETLLTANANVEETVKRECISRGRKR